MRTSADSRFLLAEREVQVWRAALEDPDDARKLEPLLSSDEFDRANRFRFPEHRRRFVIARGCLRQLLAAYLDLRPGDIAFRYQEAGKPELAGHHPQSLSFNVSHSGDLAAFAFAKARKIGVDVEMIRHDVDVEDIPKRFFSPSEQQTLAALQGDAKYQGFFNCWTRKEAYVKAVGSGLSLPLRDFDVSLVPGDPARLLATRPDATAASRWTMASLDFGSSCAAAIAVEGIAQEIHVTPFKPY